MKPIALYFDEVVDKGGYGQTKSAEKILHNLKLIGKYWLDTYKDILQKEKMDTIFAPTGRFLSIITASASRTSTNMTTLDLLHNTGEIRRVTSLLNANHDQVLAVCKQIEYDKDYNKFILLEGELPSVFKSK